MFYSVQQKSGVRDESSGIVVLRTTSMHVYDEYKSGWNNCMDSVYEQRRKEDKPTREGLTPLTIDAFCKV